MLVYDAVVAVAKADVEIAKKSVVGLSLHSKARRIFVITGSSNFHHFDELKQRLPAMILVDEDTVIDGVSIAAVRSFFGDAPERSKRVGWYFQQFLKMGMALSEEIADHYLIWDADTILLRPTDFIDETGRMLITVAQWEHQPYYRTLKRVLGIGRIVDFSFICEHQMVSRSIMSEMIDAIWARSPDSLSWVWAILSKVAAEDLPKSGFSEYETYGNYAFLNHADKYRVRSLPSFRSAMFVYGKFAPTYSLYSLGKCYHWASFEKWETPSRFVWLHRLNSLSAYSGARLRAALTGHRNPLLEAVRMIGAQGVLTK